jgi:hypothetical protein
MSTDHFMTGWTPLLLLLLLLLLLQCLAAGGWLVPPVLNALTHRADATHAYSILIVGRNESISPRLANYAIAARQPNDLGAVMA